MAKEITKMSITTRLVLLFVLAGLTVVPALAQHDHPSRNLNEAQSTMPSIIYSPDCTDMEESFRGLDVDGLRLEARLLTPQVDVGSRVVLRITATNVSGAAKALAECAPYQDYTLCIENPFGVMVRVEWQDYGGRYRHIDHNLAPGESYASDYVVSDVWNFCRPGPYHITAGRKVIGKNGRGSVGAVSNSAELWVTRPSMPRRPAPIFYQDQIGVDSQGFSLTASLSQSESKGDNAAYDLVLCLKNNNKEKRVLYQSDTWSNYVVRIESPNGRMTRPGEWIDTTRPSKRVPLEPGGQITEVYPLRERCTFAEEGTYRITAACLVPASDFSGFTFIFSNTLSITVTKKSDGKYDFGPYKPPTEKPKEDSSKQDPPKDEPTKPAPDPKPDTDTNKDADKGAVNNADPQQNGGAPAPIARERHTGRRPL